MPVIPAGDDIMTFFLKIGLGLLVLVGGSVLLVNNVPSLKASVLEALNPRVREQKLIDQLKSNLQALDASIATQGGASSIIIDKTKPSYQKLITESKDLLNEIGVINNDHAGTLGGVISKATDLLIGIVASPTPQTATSASSIGLPTGQVGSSQTVVTVTVTVTPSPCK